MSSTSDEQQSGIFALVSYIPDPLGSFLTELQQSLAGDPTPQPHITILPPRPLMLSLEDASLEVKRKLEGFTRFEVELGKVSLFPETNILYLEVTKGSGALQELHNVLNSGLLHHDERFEYSPHVTISGPLEDVASGRKQAQAACSSSEMRFRFTVSDVVFLWQQDRNEKKWERLWSQRLKDSELSDAANPHK
jgi:2'-5' RNA ligase